MDVPRKNASRNRRIKRIIYGAITIATIVAITFGVSRLKPAAPSVDAYAVGRAGRAVPGEPARRSAQRERDHLRRSADPRVRRRREPEHRRGQPVLVADDGAVTRARAC